MDLKKRHQSLENLLSQKLSQLQQLQNTLNQISAEVMELRGKIDLLKDLEREQALEKDVKRKQENRKQTNKT